jgi:hypothetical protein
MIFSWKLLLIELAITPPKRAPPEFEYFCMPLKRLLAA